VLVAWTYIILTIVNPPGTTGFASILVQCLLAVLPTLACLIVAKMPLGARFRVNASRCFPLHPRPALRVLVDWTSIILTTVNPHGVKGFASILVQYLQAVLHILLCLIAAKVPTEARLRVNASQCFPLRPQQALQDLVDWTYTILTTVNPHGVKVFASILVQYLQAVLRTLPCLIVAKVRMEARLRVNAS